MAELVKSEVIPGSVQCFRALMQRLAIRCGGIWGSAGGERLAFMERRQTKTELVAVVPAGERHFGKYMVSHSVDHYYEDTDITPPTRASWSVFPLSPRGELTPGQAGIEAYEEADGQHTRIDCLDGYAPGWPALERTPIGPAFVEFCEMVLREARRPADLPQVSEEPSPPLSGKKRGSSKLEQRDYTNYIYRLTKAQEAEEIKAREPDTPWRIIAQKIGWQYGKAKRGVKLLEDARKRLKVAPPEALKTVEENRREKK